MKISTDDRKAFLFKKPEIKLKSIITTSYLIDSIALLDPFRGRDALIAQTLHKQHPAKLHAVALRTLLT